MKLKLQHLLGLLGKAIVPSGASTGAYEAVELRDTKEDRLGGKGVNTAVDNVNKIIKNEIVGMNVFKQEKIDERLIEIDGTENKSRLGANAILGVSIATAKAAASTLNMDTFKYLGGINAKKMPTPMLNIINGGKHADNNLNIQEFMIVPKGKGTFREKLETAVDIYKELKTILKADGKSVGVGDEGGFAPTLDGDEDAIKAILEAIREIKS